MSHRTSCEQELGIKLDHVVEVIQEARQALRTGKILQNDSGIIDPNEQFIRGMRRIKFHLQEELLFSSPGNETPETIELNDAFARLLRETTPPKRPHINGIPFDPTYE